LSNLISFLLNVSLVLPVSLVCSWFVPQSSQVSERGTVGRPQSHSSSELAAGLELGSGFVGVKLNMDRMFSSLELLNLRQWHINRIDLH
jgi:hypothetical protein